MIVTTNNGECNFYVFLAISSVSGPYSAIDPYVKPFFPPDPPQMTALYEFFVSCVLSFRLSLRLFMFSFCF